MFLSRTNYTHPAYLQGAKDCIPMLPGMVAWGLTMGVSMVNSGMSVVESVAMTLLVFAGSSQLAAIPLIAVGAPMWVILLTGLCVNLRFVVFSAHLRPYLMHLPRWKRLMSGYLTADLSYVQFVSKFPKPGSTKAEHDEQDAFLAGNTGLTWVAWMGASLIGIALAHQVPVQWGLGFAGILSLLGILCSLATSKLRVVAAVVSSTVAVIAYALPLKMNIVVAISAAVAMCLLLDKTQRTMNKAENKTQEKEEVKEAA
jgi:predicted branched-subunit amino acid permease